MRHAKSRKPRKHWNRYSRQQISETNQTWRFYLYSEAGISRKERLLADEALSEEEKRIPVTWVECLDYARKKRGVHPQNRHCIKNEKRHYALLREYRYWKRRRGKS